jgi:hypothetical protein
MVLLESSWPLFLIALERHSTSKAISDTSRYLAIQLYQTALQYRSQLSLAGDNVLQELFRHLRSEPFASLHHTMGSRRVVTQHLEIILETLDHPYLLSTSNDYICRVFMAASFFATTCVAPSGCLCLIESLSERRPPFAVVPLFAALLEEVTTAISVGIYGDEVSYSHLRHSKPPLASGAAELKYNLSSKASLGDHAKTVLIRCSIALCRLILRLVLFCESVFGQRNDFLDSRQVKANEASLLTKICMRSLKVCNISDAEISLYGSQQLESSILAVLTALVSSSCHLELTVNSSYEETAIEIVICEILRQGSLSPHEFKVSSRCLSHLTSGWKSKEVLINNYFVSKLRRVLRKLLPEISDWLLMWDGEYIDIGWLQLICEAPMSLVWAEVCSRIEFWVLKGHWIYARRWLRLLRLMLQRCEDGASGVQTLQTIIKEQANDLSMEDWLKRISLELPRSEVLCGIELDFIWDFMEGSLKTNRKEHFERMIA